MKKTTQQRDPQAAAKLRALIEQIAVAMITTATPDGTLRSRPMMTLQATEAGELWFFTSDDSGKANEIAEEQAVNVSYAEPKEHRYVSVTGNARLVRDSEKIHELWDEAYARFFPRGLDDPHLALLCVRIETAEYWDSGTGRMEAVADGKSRQESETAEGSDHTRVEIRATPASG